VISDRPAPPMEVDLVEEAIRYRGMQARQARGETSGSGEPP
jgi:hypothetical protein